MSETDNTKQPMIVVDQSQLGASGGAILGEAEQHVAHLLDGAELIKPTFHTDGYIEQASVEIEAIWDRAYRALKPDPFFGRLTREEVHTLESNANNLVQAVLDRFGLTIEEYDGWLRSNDYAGAPLDAEQAGVIVHES